MSLSCVYVPSLSWQMCLSRACLGKCSGYFKIKGIKWRVCLWRARTVFLAVLLHPLAPLSRAVPMRLRTDPCCIH
jgi:hypothetical protein